MRAPMLLAVLCLLSAVVGCGSDPESRALAAPDVAAPKPAEPERRPASGPTPQRRAAPKPQPESGYPDRPAENSARPPKPAGDPNREILGGDVSWPQCPPGMGIRFKETLGLPMPLPDAQYVIIGLTNGPGFYPNPCLADQVRWVKRRKLMAGAYSVLSYPSETQLKRYGGTGPYRTGTTAGRLRNAGYQQALFNAKTMRRAGLGAPLVWLDVEPVPNYDWPEDRALNAAVVTGAARGYRDAGIAVGVYSTPYLWRDTVGDLRLGVPEWRAAGETSRAEARSRCGRDWSIQGGPAIISQWLEDGRDHNITCPGTAAYMSSWFQR